MLTRLEQRYGEARQNKWLRYFAIFCRVALAAGFIPAAIVKLQGERFTGLPPNHPLGHYFDALHATGWYYTFIGVGQLTAALLLLIPATTLLGAIVYFPIIVNICALAYSTRFEGTRITTLMLLANVFLLVWDFDRLKQLLPCRRADEHHDVVNASSKFPLWFFGLAFATAAAVIIANAFMYDIRPGNSQLECTNVCKFSDGNSPACLDFCSCVYDQGNTLNTCLNVYHRDKQQSPTR